MGENWRGSEEKGERGSCWGRWKLSTYKVAIRGKVALCEARGTSVPITAAHKRPGGEGGGGRGETTVSNMSRASPNTTGWIAWPNLRLSALLVISIWKSEAGASSVSNSWVRAGEWLKSLEEVEGTPHPNTPPPIQPHALSTFQAEVCWMEHVVESYLHYLSFSLAMIMQQKNGGIELRLQFLLLIKVVIRNERKHYILSIGFFRHDTNVCSSK